MNTATTSSISVRQESLSSGIKSISTQEHRNITREGAVICTVNLEEDTVQKARKIEVTKNNFLGFSQHAKSVG
jgi:hypothetical protein